MLDIGWTELMLIGVVALIVIGPKDLPDMFRTMGRFTAKARSMARDFQRAMEQAAKETGVSDVANDLRTATSAKSLGLDKVKEAADKFEKWDPLKNAARPTPVNPAATPLTPAPMPATPAPVAAATEAAAPAAAVETPVAEMGPATRALAEKQAAKRAVIEETTAKLKAIDSGAAPVAVEPEVKARKPRAAKPKAEAPEAEVAPVKKPRAPRKKAEETPGEA